MNKDNFDYTATQTSDGFQIEFHNPSKPPINITNKDFQAFAMKLNDGIVNGKELTLSETEEIVFNIWQMLLIPENTKH